MEVWRSTLAKAGLVHSNSGVSARLAVTKLGVTAISVVYFLWDRFFHSSRLWVSELSGWERLRGGKKCLFFDKRGMHAYATLRLYYQVAQYVTVVSLHGPRELWVGQF